MRPTHALTFDIEEHFQVTAFDSPLRRRHWDGFESRVERNTAKLLTLLAEQRTRATFFVLGWVAKRHRDMVRRIANEGHEVASHGYAHELVTAQTPKQFREDVRKAKQLLEDLLGNPVPGYRAPSLTITEETNWALPILVEQGYRYDSSLPPIWEEMDGQPGANPLCHCLSTKAGLLWEVSPSTVKVAGIPLRIADNPHFRLLPYQALRWAVTRAEADDRPLLLSLCAWEVDPDQPRMNGRALAQFRHYVNLDQVEGRLRRLLQDFRFAPIRDAIPQIDGRYRPEKIAS